MLADRSRRTSWGRARLVVLVALVGGAGMLFVTSSASGHAGPPVGLRSDSSGACPGPTVPSRYNGSLSVEGGPLGPSAASGVALAYSFYVTAVYQYDPGGTVTACTLENGSVPTGTNGTFAFTLAVPGYNCWTDPPNGSVCATYSGPFGPVALNGTASQPAGYALSSRSNGTVFDLAWVADLATVVVTPVADPLSIAPGAPTTIVARPEMGNGTASPNEPNFTWSLDGSGWSFAAGPAANGSAVVVASDGAGPGNLTVSASESEGSSLFRTPTVALPLLATPTLLDSGAVNETLADAGEPVGVAVEATGAPGYAYTATVVPGMGVGPVEAPCGPTLASARSVVVRCAASIDYPAPGTTTISVDVSNGFSATSWTSPNVSVAPAVALSLAPSAPAGYVGDPIPVQVSVPAGVGVRPFLVACFIAGTAASECESTPGPSWSFDPTFASPGIYAARASVVDSSGANTTATVGVQVASMPGLGPLGPNDPNVTLGSRVSLAGSLSGGVLPVRVWWNVSGDVSPLAVDSVASDGPISASFTPTAAGPVRLTVTARDALGTEAVENRTLLAVYSPATAVRATGALPVPPVVAGTSVELTWEALDAAGGSVPDFAGSGTLTVAVGSGGPSLAYANVSGFGPLANGPESSFVVPGSAWVDGQLPVTFTPLVAGNLTVALTEDGLPTVGPTVSVLTSPDLAHLRMFDPEVRLAGTRTNRTFWHVSDRYGNPVAGAYLLLEYTSPGATTEEWVPVVPVASGGTGAWVNYSIPAPGSSVRVVDAAGDVLWGPETWTTPSVPSSGDLLPDVLASASLVGAVAAVVSGIPRRRSRSLSTFAPDEEALARELAEGRAAVIEIVRAAGKSGGATIADLWDPPPAPPDLVDWIASLVADGTLREVRTGTGEVSYELAPEPPDPARVIVDPEEIDRAVARREAEVRSEGSERP